MNYLLIDAKNVLYRAIFAADGDKQFQESGHHLINIILHFLHLYKVKFNPDKVHIFWDADRTKIWRRKFYPSYKEQRKNKERLQEASNKLNQIIPTCMELFYLMGFNQYYRPTMEADDLIYAFCRNNMKASITIVSSDSDLKQISYCFSNVSVHSPMGNNKIEPVPMLDPVIYKSLVGDKADNVDGYYGIGKIRATALCKSISKRVEFFNSTKAIIKNDDKKIIVGDKKFLENMKLIDLSLNPYLLENMMYTIKQQSKSIKFNLKRIRELIIKRKLRGVTAEMSRYIVPFKKLAEDNNGR